MKFGINRFDQNRHGHAASVSEFEWWETIIAILVAESDSQRKSSCLSAFTNIAVAFMYQGVGPRTTEQRNRQGCLVHGRHFVGFDSICGAPVTEDDNADDLWSDILTCMGNEYAVIAEKHAGPGDAHDAIEPYSYCQRYDIKYEAMHYVNKYVVRTHHI
jgi:hypothetical protein